jgi:ATP-dependent Zn protease
MNSPASKTNISAGDSNQDSTDRSTSKITATAYHEAGHAVMALAMGRTVQKVTLSPSQHAGGMRLGECKMNKGRSRASKDALQDDVLILLAGMVAESHFTGTYCRQGAAQDLRAVKRLLQQRAPSERQRERLERRLLDKTEYLLSDTSNAKAIELVGAELIKKETISGRAVRHLYEQAIRQCLS